MKESKNKERLVLNSAKFLKYVIERNKLVEVRIITNGSGTFVGYYDDPKKIIRDIDNGGVIRPQKALKYKEVPKNGEAFFYYTINEIDPELKAVSYNELQRVKFPAVSDSKVKNYTHILIDCDPERVAPISSNIFEKSKAAFTMRKIHRFLTKKGITTLPADSGNGFHLLIPVYYPNNEETVRKVRAFLHFLSNRYSDKFVKIDVSVYNPSRISKIYGSIACKGSDIVDRPHRFAQVRFPKDSSKLVPQDVFGTFEKEITEQLGSVDDQGNKSNVEYTNNEAKIRDILTKEKIEFKERKKDSTTLFSLKKCPVYNHKDGEYECGIMVDTNGKIGGKCFHSDEFHWDPHFKNSINWDKYSTSNIPGTLQSEEDLNIWFHSTDGSSTITTAIASDNPENYLTYFNNITVFNSPDYLVPTARLFPRKGITTVAAAPSTGKSTLMVNMVLNMLKSEPIFGQYRMSDTKVFYIQSDNDIDIFMHNIAIPYGYDPILHKDKLTFFHTKSAGNIPITPQTIIGLCQAAAKKYDLIIIDNKTSLWPDSVYGKNAQRDSLELVDQLKKIAIQNNIAVAFVEHVRKPMAKQWELITMHDVLGAGVKTIECCIGLNERYDELKKITGHTKSGNPTYGKITYRRRPGEGIIVPLKNAYIDEMISYKIISDEPYSYMQYSEYNGIIEEDQVSDDDITIPSEKLNSILKYLKSKNKKTYTYQDVAADLNISSLKTVRKYIETISNQRAGLLSIQQSRGGRNNRTKITIENRALLDHLFKGEVNDFGLGNIGLHKATDYSSDMSYKDDDEELKEAVLNSILKDL